MKTSDLDRQTTLYAGLGAIAVGGLGFLLGRYLMARRTAPDGDAIERDFRPAGAEMMRDPPGEWTRVDEASDESFPASDPPAVKHVD